MVMVNHMKKTISIILLLLWAVSAYAEGIGTYKDLLEFAAASNSGQNIDKWKDADGVICLTADIDMSKVKKFDGVKSFGGVFDGRGFSIMNWKAQRGLFGQIAEGGIVRNLKIDASCSMKVSNGTVEYHVGFIADENGGILENCENHGSISHRSGFTENDVYVGGVAGINKASILRCRNYGNIDSRSASVSQKGEISAHIGGIAGGGYLKTFMCPVFAWCENYGQIRFEGDFPACNLGGIVGNGFKVPVKFSINRGTVTATTVQGEPGNDAMIPQIRVGGVAGMTKGDIMGCDNFGEVSSSGTHWPVVGGICGMPHAAIVIGDCVNYGIVRITNDSPGCVGGIAGSINRPVHVRGCVNRGDITFGGFSPDRRSACGGIAGSVTVKRDAKEGAYVRNCLNYGNVSGRSGSNKYENSDNAIHTGGITGWISGSDLAVVMLKDCTNYGKVTSDGGRCGNISGACVKVQTGGKYPDDWAEAAEPMSDGSNVFGRVTDVTGKAVAGVVVSDGFQSVQTDGYGYYSMKSDLSAVRFVQISFPAEYEINAVDGKPCGYKRVARYQKAVMADFVLTPRKSPSDKYTMLMIADPQMRPFGVDNSAEAYKNSVIPDAEAFRQQCGDECYSIELGDLVYNFMTAYDDYMDITAGLKCPTFNVMGNHDYDQTTMYDSELGAVYFETYVGPQNYSFNIGKIHYVILNDIVYSRASAKDTYRSGLEEQALKWLEGDLAFVPHDTPLVVCAHSQMFKKRSSHSSHNLNYAIYKELISRYSKVYSWAGHNHENYYYDYAGKELGLDNISCITVSRSTGALRLNKYLNNDGTPQGYMVMEVDGDSFRWYYKSVGRNGNWQMKVYPPRRTDGARIVANIWNYGDGWSNVEWWENGKKVADMSRTEMEDPDYVDIYSEVKNPTTRKYCAPLKSYNMFEVMPSDNVRSGEVHVTDNFGVTYISEIEW